MKLINGESIKEVFDEGYTFFGILELDKIKEKMKDDNKQEISSKE